VFVSRENQTASALLGIVLLIRICQDITARVNVGARYYSLRHILRELVNIFWTDIDE